MTVSRTFGGLRLFRSPTVLLLACVLPLAAARGQDTPAEKPAEQPPAEPDARLKQLEAKLEAVAASVEKLAASAAPPEAEKQDKPAEDAKPDTEDTPPAEPEQSQDEPAKPEQPQVKLPAEVKLDGESLKPLNWRSIGPANMSGRITDVEVHATDPSHWWLATASGGVLKTTNRGTTVEHQFDKENTVSVGAIASDPSNKETLWVGTGEINPRNSVSYGDGVYKSTDGGKSFEHVGLAETYQISRILVHPKNSDVVYVGAQGRLYGTNDARGVYKTSDGGKNWEKVLYLDDRTGVIDMIMHPEDPDTLIVAMWDRLRDGFDSWPGDVPKPEGIDGYDPIRKWGPKAGLYKTTDGGKNWKKLSAGLPTGMTGRVGLDWQLNSPHTIYAIIDCEDIGKGPKPFTAFLGIVSRDVDGLAKVTQIMPESPAAEAGVQVGDVIKSVDDTGVFVTEDLLAVLRKKIPGERVRLTLQRGEETLEIAPKLDVRPGTRGGPAEPFYGITGKDEEDRIVLTAVTEESPAAKAGLQVGDVIVSVNEKKPENYESWIAEAKDLAIGDVVALEIDREGDKIAISLTLGRKPGTGPAGTAIMGIRGEDAKQPGALLTSITEDGPSEKAGLKANDVVVSVAGEKVESYEDLIAEIRSRNADDEMPVEVLRGEEKLAFTITLGDRNAGGDRPYTFSYYGQRPNIQDQQGAEGYKYGGVYKSTDAGESWQRVNSINVRPMYFSVVKVDPNDDQRVYLLGVSQYQSDNGGVTFTGDFGRGVHSDAHDMWINPNDGRQMVIGCDGGFYVTYDRGGNWDHINTVAIGQFYHVAIAPKEPYWVYGGLQDNGSWGGPAISPSGGAVIQDWISVGGGDGFVCRVDPEDPDLVYTESQNGSIRRRNLRTGEGASIRPPRVSGKSYRYNWNTPFILSHHNSKIFYSAGNYVFRSVDRGNDQQIISPEITLTERGSATALAESPRDPNVLYVGSDDGALWRTRDGGQNWDNITKNLGVEPRWVATIEPSREKTGRVYVCLDGHRSDDDRPYVLVSEDFGDTFSPLSDDLPRGSSRCLREDIVNPNLLYLGTEFAFWISLDRGQNWTQCNQSLPTVAIHEVAMHESIDEIVLATHGRSLWACDVSALRGLSAKALAESSQLLPPADVIRWRRQPSRGRTNRRYVAENPSRQAELWYTLAADAKEVLVQIESIEGKKVAELKGKTSAGLHNLSWNMTQPASRRGQRPTAAPNGDYRVTLLVDEKQVATRVLSLKRDPTLSTDALSEQEFAAAMLELEAAEAELEEDEVSGFGPSQR